MPGVPLLSPLPGRRIGTWARAVLLGCAGFAVGFGASTALAYDVQVDSDTTFRAYEVRSNAARVFWTRRRFSQRLTLSLVQWLAEPRSDRPVPRLRVHTDLRFDQELGDTCLVADAGRCLVVSDGQMRATYEPLAIDGGVTIPTFYAEVTGIPPGASVRAGRQMLWDPIGIARTDGVSVQAEPVDWVSLRATYGLLVRRTSFAGRDSYARPGIPQLDLPPDELRRSGRIAGPAASTLLGLNAWVGIDALARAGLHYRVVDGPDGLLQREAAVSLGSFLLAPLRLDGHGVFDTRDGTLVDAQGEAALLFERVTARARVRRQLPRFDYGTIWAFFAASAYSQASLGADWYPFDGLQVGGELRGRHMYTGVEVSGADLDLDLGFEGRAAWQLARLRLELSGFAWRGDLGPTWGTTLASDYRLRQWLTLYGELNAYRIEGVSVGLDRSFTFGEACGASFPIAEGTRGNLELSHAYSPTVGHRTSLLAYLHLGAWR